MKNSTLAQQLSHIATARQGSGGSVPCLGNVASQMWCTEPNSPPLHPPQVNRTTATTGSSKHTQDALSISKRDLQDTRDQLGSEKRNRPHSVHTYGRISTTMESREDWKLSRTQGGPPLPGPGHSTQGMGSATCV